MDDMHAVKMPPSRAPLYPIWTTGSTEGEHLLFAFGCLFVSRGGKWRLVETF